MNSLTDQFSLVIGGPFHEVLGRLKLLDSDDLPIPKSALLLALLAWLPSAALALVDYFQHDRVEALSYFQDYMAYIRCLIAIPLVVLTERSAHFRLTPIIKQFIDARLIAQSSVESFHQLVRRADRRSASSWAEGLLAAMVILIAVFGGSLDVELGGFDWDGRVVDGEAVYTAAGLWSHWGVKPLFQFLMLRWLWRFAVWGWLLVGISRLKLRLVAYHPDGSGGLGFLSVYPMVFSGLIFALSSVLAAQLVGQVYSEGVPQNILWTLVVCWIGFVLLVFVGPLTVFVEPLYRLREQAIFELGRFSGEHQQQFQEKWLESRRNGTELLGSEDVSSVSDLAPIGASPYNLRTLPITWPMMLHLALFAGAPMLAVVATQMPLSELLELLTQVI